VNTINITEDTQHALCIERISVLVKVDAVILSALEVESTA
jgi:hypothetical protein